MDKSVQITIETVVACPIKKVWETWTTPHHIMQWNHASPDWHTPRAENDLKEGGKFSYTMAAKDGSFSFDFCGIYTSIKENEQIGIRLGDDRNIEIIFTADGDKTHISETFDAETENPVDLQRSGWQAILDNFKKYAESL